MPRHKTNLKFDSNNATQLRTVLTTDLIVMMLSPHELPAFVFDDEQRPTDLVTKEDRLAYKATSKERLAVAQAAIIAEINRRIPAG